MSRRNIAVTLTMVCMFFLALPHESSAQWAKSFTSGTDPLWSFIEPSPSSAGNFSMIGQLQTSETVEPAIVASHDSSGKSLWAKSISTTGKYSLFGIERADGSFFITGTKDLSTTETQARDIIWAKFNSAWAPVYQKIFGGIRDEDINFGDLTSDNGIIGVGESNSYGTSASDYDILVGKIKSDGNLLWAKAFHYGEDDEGVDMTEMSGGGFAVLGYVETVAGARDILVFKLDANGNIVWKKLFSTALDDWVVGMWQAKNGDLLVLGNTENDFGESSIFLIRLTAAGGLGWQKMYTSQTEGAQIFPNNLVENADGTIVISGDMSVFSISAFSFVNYIVVAKLGSTGNILAQKTLSDGNLATGTVMASADGELLLSGGSTVLSTTSNSDIIYGKINPSTLAPIWSKKFSSTSNEVGGIVDTGSAYFLSGTFYNSTTPTKTFGMTLDANGGYANCSYLKTVTLTQGDPKLVASAGTLTQTTPTITSRATGQATNTTLTVTPKTLTEATLCAGTVTKPAAPTNLKATSASASKINLTWTAASGATSYKVYRKKGTAAATLLTTTSAVSYADTAASGNTTATSYSYYVQACNSAGCSASTQTAVVPYAPTTPTATAGTGSVTVKWTDKSGNETGFEIFRKPDACSAAGTWTKVATVLTNVKTYTNTGLAKGAVYSYKVRAFYKSAAAPFAYGYSPFTGCVNATVK